MRRYFTLLLISIPLLTISQGIEDVLPNRIGTGTHASVINTQSSLLGLALRNISSTDIFRYKNMTDIEYFNGSSWTVYSTDNWKKVLDGYYASYWDIPYTQVRFVIDLGGSWNYPSAVLISQDWGPSDNPYSLQIETSNDKITWSTRLADTQAPSPNTALNIFSTNSGAGSDRYVRLTFSSNASSSSPMRINTLSGFTKRSTGLIQPISISHNQYVGIGTTTPTHKLEVNGAIRSKEVKVEAAPWPDYVFEPDYNLRTLEETAAYIKFNKHLPEIPSAIEMEANGLMLGEMNMLLLKKIEELTLYAIEQEKKLKNQGNLEMKIDELLKRIEELEKSQK